MCDILPQRRFSLAPADHGASFEKKRDEILQRPTKIPSLNPPQPKVVEEELRHPDDGYASRADYSIQYYLNNN
jgi:hypothetical protein